jgi:hypothetical protein
MSPLQATNGGGMDVFITKLTPGSGAAAGVTVTQSGGTTSVTEGGATDTYTVVLNSAPTANVTIALSPGTQVAVAPATLTFTAANWNTAQTVTVTAVDDAVAEGPHTATITHTATSADTAYNAIAVASVTASITDNDGSAPGVLVTQSGGSTDVAEGGATDTYTLVLNTAPTANVTIALNPSTQVSLAPVSLTFTPANWNIAQAVTVTAVDDAAVEGAHTGTISHTAASTDAAYNGIAIASVSVNISDNDGVTPPPPTSGFEGAFGFGGGVPGAEGSFAAAARNARRSILQGPFALAPANHLVLNVAHDQRGTPPVFRSSEPALPTWAPALVATIALTGLVWALIARART